MAEVAVAFPNDEVTAEVIASRLRSSGIAARVDRGLHGSWQVPAAGQMTVFVDATQATRARSVLGTNERESGATAGFLRIAIAFLVIALVVGIVAILATVVSR